MLRTWRVGEHPSRGSRGLARCGSWRCVACRRWKAAQDFARITAAFAPYPPEQLAFVVLTLDQLGTYGPVPWSCPADAHARLSGLTRGLLARVRRRWRGEPGSRWVMVIESHGSGWPHANLLMHAPALARELPARGDDDRAPLVRGELAECVYAAGWGRTTAERVRGTEQAAGYLIKVAARETSKVLQLPVGAAPNFRRMRSGRGFLPPVDHDPQVTGAMFDRRDGCVRIIGQRRAPRGSALETAAVIEAATVVAGETRPAPRARPQGA